MDQILTAKIRKFLQLANPTDEEIREGATMLLRCNPARERAIYNSAMVRPRSMLPWIRTDLKKYLDIRQRGLTTAQVSKYNQETLTRVRESLSIVPDNVENKAPEVLQVGIKGKRPDHDSLPEWIRSLWEKNAERWKKMRQVHAQLSVMIEKPDYAACDGNELCYQLRNMDDALRNDYQVYDNYDVVLNKTEDTKDYVEVFTDNVKTIQNARTSISRGLGRKTEHTEASLKKLQEAVNTLFALKQSIKPETIEKLKAIGIIIPNA